MIFSTLTIPKDGSPGEDRRSMVTVAVAAEANSTIITGGGVHGDGGCVAMAVICGGAVKVAQFCREMMKFWREE